MTAQFSNTLFVTLQGASVRKQHETIVVNNGGETLLQVPIHHLTGVVCFGRVFVSPEAMYACATSGIGISYLTDTGRFLARVEGPASGNVLLRRKQYRSADEPASTLVLARGPVLGKIANCRTLIQRARRDRPDRQGAKDADRALDSIKGSFDLALKADDIDRLRGYEGEVARTYFNVFQFMILSDDEAFTFTTRNRRPPKDAVNALLSFAYALLTHDCASALQAVGLDPAVGYLHADRPGRLSLALDLMEEFRPAIADRFVLSLINLGQVKADDFVKTGSGAVSLTDDARKTFLAAWQKRKQEQIIHPYTGENVTYSLLPFYQARLLARTIRGDIKEYPPFLIK